MKLAIKVPASFMHLLFRPMHGYVLKSECYGKDTETLVNRAHAIITILRAVPP